VLVLDFAATSCKQRLPLATSGGELLAAPGSRALQATPLQRRSFLAVAAEMLLLRSRLRSEPEEVNVASGVVAMRRSDVTPQRVRRQNAYATLGANFHGCAKPVYATR
jgi:hypothetical protein